MFKHRRGVVVIDSAQATEFSAREEERKERKQRKKKSLLTCMGTGLGLLW